MTRLSVNVNKIATLRNARGGSVPDVLQAAVRLQEWGAHGITVHPRPDARHITYADVRSLRPVVHTEFNVEGFPSSEFLDLVLEVRPDQVTLVPDPPDVKTSQAGWKAGTSMEMLPTVVDTLRRAGIRTSLFVAPDADDIMAAQATGTDRIELYTEPYAVAYRTAGAEAAVPFGRAAAFARSLGMGVNAGHDLDQTNLADFVAHVPHLLEVSIGHALISDALYLGLEATLKAYLNAIAEGFSRTQSNGPSFH
jgi:pyridoxine 5-phosphate synthase